MFWTLARHVRLVAMTGTIRSHLDLQTYQRCLLGFGCSPDSTVVFIRNPVKIYGFPPPLIQLGVFGRVSVRHIVCPIGTPLFVAWAYCLAAKAAAVPFLYIIFVYLVVGLRVKGPRKSVYK